jgi:hypothetical protein
MQSSNGLIADPVLARRAALAQDFAAARPFRHVAIDGFLAPDFAQGLLDQFPAFGRGNALAEHGRPGDKSTVERIRALGDRFVQLDDLVRSRGFLDWLGEVTGIPGLLYDPGYVGGGTHDNRQGASLDPHIDFNFHPIEGWHRRLNLIVYLNPGWQPDWGGALALYRDPASDPTPAHVFAPLFNRCVVFETNDHSWHGFGRIALPPEHAGTSRRSLAFYFYTRAEKDAPPETAHSTVYVTRPLPAHLHAGHVLTEADLAELRAVVADKDGRIAIQYDEIARLMTLARAHERGFTGRLMYLARKARALLRR